MTPSLYSQTFAFLKPFSGKSIMPILNGNWTSIRFKHEKMGRKISEGNSAMYPLYKSLIGIRILK